LSTSSNECRNKNTTEGIPELGEAAGGARAVARQIGPLATAVGELG
jgi:hypothetical protein